jgi:lipoprotein-anchoring transpeptidase ErfK/SrfK
MKSKFSRRDFLKLGGLTLSGLAFSPFLPGLNSFDDSFIVRIATKEMAVRKEPTDKSSIELSWYRDDLVHVYEAVTAEEPKQNPVWYRTWGGYIHRGRLQRVKTLYQIPLEAIPEGTRFLTEVSVPFTAPYKYSKMYGWELVSGPPFYYGSVHWIEAIEAGPKTAEYDGPWYRVFDELDSNVAFYVPAIHLRVLPPIYMEPITPDIPYEQKMIEVNLTTQTLNAYEYGKIVFQTNISSGIPGYGGGDKIPTTTPTGKFTILDKVPSKHMGYSYFGSQTTGNLLADVDNYVLPGVPWSCFFTKAGHAFHGTYWHENFGLPMSHGCVNMRSNEANWIFRWAKPNHTNQSTSNHGGLGTMVEIHY